MALPANQDDRLVTVSELPHIQWHTGTRVPAAQVPPPYRELVLSRDSLTRRLKRRCRHHFGVRILSERFATPTPQERACLNLRPRERCWIREVLLMGDNEPWILARTLIPLSTLQGRFRRLRHLGRKPLGEILFREPGWQRGPLDVGYDSRADDRNPGFARRSTFRNGTNTVLITEFFFAELWHHHPLSEQAHEAA